MTLKLEIRVYEEIWNVSIESLALTSIFYPNESTWDYYQKDSFVVCIAKINLKRRKNLHSIYAIIFFF